MSRVLEGLLFLGLVIYVAVLTHDVQDLRSDVRSLERADANATRLGDARPTPSGGIVTPTVQPQTSYGHVRVAAAGLNYAFKPAQLDIRKGTRVTWINTTADFHSVTSVHKGQFNRTLYPHKTVTIRFDRPGRYSYFCEFHPYQRGVIVVRG